VEIVPDCDTSTNGREEAIQAMSHRGSRKHCTWTLRAAKAVVCELSQSNKSGSGKPPLNVGYRLRIQTGGCNTLDNCVVKECCR